MATEPRPLFDPEDDPLGFFAEEAQHQAHRREHEGESVGRGVVGFAQRGSHRANQDGKQEQKSHQSPGAGSHAGARHRDHRSREPKDESEINAELSPTDRQTTSSPTTARRLEVKTHATLHRSEPLTAEPLTPYH